MKAKHCGECRLFKNEDINGDGWCEEYEMPTRCDKKCNEKENKGNLRKISSNHQTGKWENLSQTFPFLPKTERQWKKKR